MKTELTELPESRVRLEVEVAADQIEKRMDRAAKQLAGEMKIPGFRKGKVPPQLVIQRIGREAVVEQAIRDSLPEWYEQAIVESGVPTVGDPKLDVEKLPEEGEELAFSIEIGVRPKAELGDYKGLEVGKARSRSAGRADRRGARAPARGLRQPEPGRAPAADGDVVVIDYEGNGRRRGLRGRHRNRHDRGARRAGPPARIRDTAWSA